MDTLSQPKKQTNRAALVLLTLAFCIAHIICNAFLGDLFFAWAGGVQKEPNGWTRFGGIDKAWTCPIYLPGCTVLEIEEDIHGRTSVAQPYAVIGLLLILAGSLAAGWALASLVMAVRQDRKPVLGRYWWRLWLLVVGWGWIPVPLAFSWVYQWTVWY
jgi:hypothetical protein